MRRASRLCPVVTGLETRNLLSAAAVATVAATAEVAPVAKPPTRLIGHIVGTTHSVSSNPDVGKTLRLNGTGLLTGYGRVSLRGNVRATGFVSLGQSTGTVILTDPKGALRLELVGPTQRGFAEFPEHYAYTITGGTNRHAGATGSGTIDFKVLKLFGRETGFDVRFHPANS